MNDKRDDIPETLQDRLAALDQRIVRMRALNTRHGDVFALRLVRQAQAERKQLLDSMPDRGKEKRGAM